jgi:hypothetical protein
MTDHINSTDIFNFSPKQLELANCGAPLRLAVGGVRSGKTSGALMYGVMQYTARFPGCDMLVLRRTFRELEAGAITDLKTFCKIEGGKLFDWNDTKHIATFYNKSRIFFGSCTHNKERDIEQYLGQGYPFILLDECAQFSPDAYELLQARNTVNASCEPLDDGTYPSPIIWACTNPIGPFWLYYKTLFIDRKPVGVDGATRDPDGRWYVMEAGERRCVYDPKRYACVHSTVLDNPAILKRDPGILARLNALPPAKRDKLLFGLLDRVEGQYFDSFNPDYHMLNLREDPDAVIWQPHQAVWAGWDWGMSHYNCVYFFTKALVRRPGGDYKLRTICFDEIVTNNKDQNELVSMVAAKCHLPGSNTSVKLSAIYFSHEKFNRIMEQHSPADILSRHLRAAGQCILSPATRDRIGRASFLYNMLQTGDLVILDNCADILAALPTLQRDPDHLDDVLKVDNRADDCYDAFSYGLFGQLANRAKPEEQREREKIEAITNPFAKRMAQFRLTMNKQAAAKPYRFPWEKRLLNPDGTPFKRGN